MLLGSFILAGCASQQISLPVEQPISNAATPTPDNTSSIQTHGLSAEQAIEGMDNPLLADISDPWKLIERSRELSPVERNPFLLRASELFLDQHHFSTAFTMLDEVDVSLLASDGNTLFNLIKARYTLLSGDALAAETQLNQIKNTGTIHQGLYARLLKLDIAISTRLNKLTEAIDARITLDSLLKDDHDRLNNQRLILNTLSREDTLFATQNPDTILAGWLALATLKRQAAFSGTAAEQNIALWRQQFPNHPARVLELSTARTSTPISANQIALLLPLTSKLGRAAQAFKAGFDAAAAQSSKTTGRFDTSRVYDIGSETDLVSFYHQSAINDGADFIIGPLGRSSSLAMLNHLSTQTNVSASTLILSGLEPQHNAIPNLWGLALSPEQDAAAIAERAIKLGYRQALVMQKNNAWGARVNAAFTTAFESKGGHVVGNQRFQPKQVDNSVEVKNLLNINASEIRHLRLQKMLGRNLKSSVRRRDDVDFIFLAGNTADARRILPLVKFYRAHNLPVFATSSAYTGRFNKLTDEDISGLTFSDLPWHLRAPSASTQTLPYNNATLNRLYALGYAAFEVIPKISQLQSDPWLEFNAHTMTLSMDENHNLNHRMAWGKYTQNGVQIKAE
ncbi:MAG: penicillin-binding protein activator [Arenicellales bacterium]